MLYKVSDFDCFINFCFKLFFVSIRIKNLIFWVKLQIRTLIYFTLLNQNYIKFVVVPRPDTLSPKTVHTLSSVWIKTTLITDGMGGAGVDPQTCKTGHTKDIKCLRFTYLRARPCPDHTIFN